MANVKVSLCHTAGENTRHYMESYNSYSSDLTVAVKAFLRLNVVYGDVVLHQGEKGKTAV